MAGALVLTMQAHAQQNKNQGNNLDNVIQVKNGSFFYRAKDKSLPEADVAPNLVQMLGLNNKNSFVKLYEKKDDLGFTQFAFQQYFQNVKVDNAIILVHAKNGYVQSINGKIASLTNLVVTPSINKENALSYAKKALDVRKIIKSYPVELTIANTGKSDAYILAYKVRIDGTNAKSKIVMMQVYIDASTGKAIKQVNLIKSADVVGTAHTLYSGTVNLTVDSNATGYKMRDNTRKITTYDAGGCDVSQTSLPLFTNPRDYVNTTRNWNTAPALTETNMTSANNNVLFNLGAGNYPFIGGLIKRKIGTNLTTVSWPDITQYGSLVLPLSSKNIYQFPTDTSYSCGFGDMDFSGNSFELMDSVYFKVNNLTVGTHIWSDGNGNGGNYKIEMKNNPAADAHWGMQKTHDFYKIIFNRDSYDGNGSEVTNYINGMYPLSGTQDNASAMPSPYFCMVYGLGDGQMFDAFVGLDVMGHEFTHMVTESNGNGGLDYQGESGALNESFSDIFGTSIEFYTKGSAANWTIGEDLPFDGSALRSMSDPNLYQNPDTYEGDFWADPTNTGDGDEGGVHNNSSVQNKWFYLLSVGGTGINDNGDAYAVTGIGIEKAEKIAYRNLTTYIMPSSDYYDAYAGSKEATLDLFGSDSTQQEFNSVRNAWYAVGIGEIDTIPVPPPPPPVTSITGVKINNGDLQIYPNPASTTLTITSSINQKLDAQILNVVGVPVLKIQVGKGSNTFDISTLPKGVYMVRYNTGDKGYVQKFTVI